TLSAEVQACSGRWSNWAAGVAADSGGRQRKVYVVPFVDREVIDSLLIDSRGDRGFGSLDYFRGCIGNGDNFGKRSRLQHHVVELGSLPDRHCDFCQYKFLEIR